MKKYNRKSKTYRFRIIAIFFDRWHWVLLVIAAPFLIFPSPSRSLALIVIPGLWIIACLAGRNEPLPRTPLNASLLLMFCMVLVSLWSTFDLAYSLSKISGMVLGIGVFFAVAHEAKHPNGFGLSLLLFLGCGLGIATLGVFGTSWFNSKITLFDPVIARLPRFIMGFQGAESGFHPNEVAGALIWVLPLMITICIALFSFQRINKNKETIAQRKGWLVILSGWRLTVVTILFLVVTFFVCMVFLLSQSRGGYIGLALTLLLLILIALPRKLRFYSLIVLLVFGLILGFLVASRWESVRIWISGNNLAADPALSLNTLEGRLEIWSRAIYGIQDFPFTGMGMNAFRKVVPVLYPLFSIAPDIDIGHAHNEFLQAALDLGIPGLIAFVGLYIGTILMLVEVWRTTRLHQTNDGYESVVTRCFVFGLGGGLIAHLLYGLTDTVALGAKPGLLFWILLGLIAGLYGQKQAVCRDGNSCTPTNTVGIGLNE